MDIFAYSNERKDNILKTRFKSGFNSRGRTANVVRNANIALICQILNTILGFVSRSVFILMLGKTYLGVNGIFSNVLTILSFAELGIGTAIVYNLYKPLKEHDEQQVGILVAFYRKVYRIIAIIILAVGIALIPFLKYLIKNQPDIPESITLLYVLFLSSTVITYFAAHKKSLLSADQNQHVTNIYHQVIHFVQIILQIIFLVLTRNYILYLVIQIVCAVLENILISRQTDKIYPFLKEYKESKLDKGFLQSIKKDVGALFIYKMNSAVIHGTDNILIAAIEEEGVQSVGLYSNYTLITETANTFIGIITNALTPSVGNLNAGGDERKKEQVFYTIMLVSAWLYGFVCSGIFALGDIFVTNWIGKDYLLDAATLFAIVLQLYIRSVHYAAYTYRVTCGLFVQSKYVPILTSLLNIGLSIWWGLEWGLFGILFATSIARILTIGISDPVLVFKYIFKKNPISYYLKYAYYLALTVILYFASSYVVGQINIFGWFGFIIKLLVYSIIYNGLFIAINLKTKEFKYVWSTGVGYIKQLSKKIRLKFHK